MATLTRMICCISTITLICTVVPISCFFWGDGEGTTTPLPTEPPRRYINLTACPKGNCYVSGRKTINCAFTGCDRISEQIPHDAKVIQLQENKIRLVGPKLPYKNLTTLDLSVNHISKIDKSAFVNLHNVEALYLSNNNISSLNESFSVSLRKLKYLYLDYNNLTKIKNEIFFPFLPSLEVLDLGHNMIGSLEMEAFSDIQNLKVLHLENNNITDIRRDHFLRLIHLKELLLNGNKIKALPSEIFGDARNLQHIDLSFNQITNIRNNTFSLNFPHIHKSQLLVLDLSHNNITNIEENAFQNLDSLQVLKLERNALKTLLPGILPKNLVQFHLHHMTNLEHIQPHTFSGLSLLQIVDISNNKKLVNFSPHAFDSDFKVLKLLDLSRNGLKTLSEDIVVSWNSIEETSLHGNPWECDCNLQWMKEVYMRPADRETIRCASPSHLSGQNLVDVPSDELICGAFARLKRYQGKLGLVLLIIFTLFFIVGIASFIYRCRHKVFPCHYGQTSKYTALYNTNVPDEEVQITETINVDDKQKKILKDESNGKLPEPVAL